MTKEQYHAMKREKERIKAVQKKNRLARMGSIDRPFLALTLLLTIVGLVMLFSASFPSSYYENGDATYTFRRQLYFAIAGLVAMYFCSKINYQSWRSISRWMLYLAFFLLLLVIIPGVGITRNNATRWLGFGSLTFQPSEYAKLAVVIYFADDISKKRERMLDFVTGVRPYALILVIIAVELILEPHLSGTILIVATGLVMMFVGGMDLRLTLLGVGGVFVVGFSYVKLVEHGVISYGASRILMWQDPWLDPLDDGYQMVQSLIAVGSGGLTGLGFGKSREKFLYLPEESNDFIFAVVCEEMGFIGAVLILCIFAALIIRGFRIALHARDRYGSLLVIGFMTHLGLQTFLNVAVVTGLVPATGISLPFFSYGGSALLFQLAEMGIVLSVSRQIESEARSMEEIAVEGENR